MEHDAPDLVLRPLGPHDEAEALDAERELAAAGWPGFLPQRRPGESWADFAARIESQTRGEGIPPGFVPCTFLVAEAGGHIVGRVSIRHELNDALRRVGGHVGYGVRPAWRRRGYATELLRRGLAICVDLGLEDVLVTCDDDNVGSAAVIERCGGVLENVVRDPGGDGTLKRRYWIHAG